MSAQATLTPALARILLQLSPAHYWRLAPENPNRDDITPSAPERIARAARYLMAQPSLFDDAFTVAPGYVAGPRYSKTSGRTILSEPEYDAANAMATAVVTRGGRACRLLCPDTAGAVIDEPVRWQRGNVLVKARCHVLLTQTSPPLVALHKPVKQASSRACRTAMVDMLHPLELYMAMLVAGDGDTAPAPSGVIIYQETRPPYATRVVAPSAEWLDMAARQFDRAVHTAQACLDADRWPDAERVEVMELPAYADTEKEGESL